jgi:flagellar biosynthesis protein FlhB
MADMLMENIAIDISGISIPEHFVLDLQRFASSESEGRTEKATEHKKRKAREEGRVALSKELPAVIVTLFSFIAIYFLARFLYETMYDNLRFVIENCTKIDIEKDNVFYDLFLIPFMKMFLPIGAVAFIAAALSNYLQIGLKFTMKALKPDWKRISPNVMKYLKNQVFSVTGLFNLVKSLIKIIIIGVVSYQTIFDNLIEMNDTMFEENIMASFVFISKVSFDLVVKSVIILLIFSIVDILFVRWQFEESLKMKKEEIKQEVKELYGDPLVRSRLRQMYQTLLSQKKMLGEVPKADVVVTNPTHYAVALQFDKNIDEAPRVTAKGKDKFAQRIKEVARENDVFMYENVGLARSLYSEVEVNEVIPRVMYSLVINAYKLAMEYNEKKREKVAI